MVLQKCHASTETSAFVRKWAMPLEDAVHHLDDPFYLQGTRFVRLSTIQKLAKEKYPGKYQPESLIVVDILKECVKKIAVDFGHDKKYSRAAKYLELIVNGISCKAASKMLGLSREHVSRDIRPQALRLLAHQFVATVRSKEYGVSEQIPSLIS